MRVIATVAVADRIVVLQQVHLAADGRPANVVTKDGMNVFARDAHLGRAENGAPFFLPQRIAAQV